MKLTSSEMRQWQTCQRGWWLSSYRGLRRKQHIPSLPNVGNLVHDGLEAYYNSELENPADLVAEKRDKLIADFPDYAEQVTQDAALAAIMLEGYVDWAAAEGVDYGLEIIGAEQSVEAEVGPYTLLGKIDARVRRESDGALLQLEHKTCGNLTDHPKWAQSNPQFLTYDLLAFMTKPDGVPTDGVIVNMLRRVKRTPRAKPPFYGRHEVRHNVDELRAHYTHVVGIGNQIAAARQQLDAGYDPQLICPPAPSRNHTWSCECAVLGAMFDDGSDVEDYLSEFYEQHDPLARYAPEEEAE